MQRVFGGANPAVHVPRPDAGGGPEWLPEGAVAYADFVNGNYYFDGAEHTLAEMFTEDAANFGTFDPNSVVAGQGLVCDTGEGQNPRLSAAAEVDCLPLSGGGFTAVLDFVFSDSASNCQILVDMFDAPEYNEDWVVSRNSDGFGTYGINQQLSNEPLSSGDQTCRVAFTAIEGQLSVSDGGAAVLTDTTLLEPATVNRIIFAVSTATGKTKLTSITIYPPVADAALPGLSTLP